ncbi:hypothetical protein KR038_005314 [Drosophila bunnanda]|nr:hypothetical protein KR038_005314 [Drosophila bunnanda]
MRGSTRFHHVEVVCCIWCHYEVDKTAEHVLFSCDGRKLEALLELSIGVDYLSGILANEVNWQAVSSFAAEIMTKFRID